MISSDTDQHSCDYCGQIGEWDFGSGSLHKVYGADEMDYYYCTDVHACRERLVTKCSRLQKVLTNLLPHTVWSEATKRACDLLDEIESKQSD